MSALVPKVEIRKRQDVCLVPKSGLSREYFCAAQFELFILASLLVSGQTGGNKTNSAAELIPIAASGRFTPKPSVGSGSKGDGHGYFVLVHGVDGAWCWQRVVRLLTRAGHDVFVPTLTGLCERSHLLTPAVDLDTHMLDIVNELKWQELKGVVIVGHSYGGMVISGVAEKMEKAIRSFVMLDAFMPENGQSVVDIWPAAMRDRLWRPSAAARPQSLHERPRLSRSTKRAAPGSTRNARRSRSDASCKN